MIHLAQTDTTVKSNGQTCIRLPEQFVSLELEKNVLKSSLVQMDRRTEPNSLVQMSVDRQSKTLPSLASG